MIKSKIVNLISCRTMQDQFLLILRKVLLKGKKGRGVGMVLDKDDAQYLKDSFNG